MSTFRKICQSTVTAGMMVLAVGSPLLAQDQKSADPSSQVAVDADGTVHIPAYALPLSTFMSEETKRAYIGLRRGPPEFTLSSDVAKMRKALDDVLKAPLEKVKSTYPVIV